MQTRSQESTDTGLRALQHDYRSLILNLKAIAENIREGDLSFDECLVEIERLVGEGQE